METGNIREKLHQYVNTGDERLIKMMYAVAKEYNDEADFDVEFSKEELELFQQRREKRLKGESSLYGWKEAKSIINGKK